MSAELDNRIGLPSGTSKWDVWLVDTPVAVEAEGSPALQTFLRTGILSICTDLLI
jgi:hypothetical protein